MERPEAITRSDFYTWLMNRTPFTPGASSDVFSALSNERNLCVLRYLYDLSIEEATVEDIAEDIAASQVADAFRNPERTAHSLHHRVLPKLADAGIVEYDPDTKTVRCTDHAVLAEIARFAAETDARRD